MGYNPFKPMATTAGGPHYNIIHSFIVIVDDLLLPLSGLPSAKPCQARFDVIRLRDTARAQRGHERASAEFSWFPGMAWRMASCPGCSVRNAPNSSTRRPPYQPSSTQEGGKQPCRPFATLTQPSVDAA